jgi:hypothetical protein
MSSSPSKSQRVPAARHRGTEQRRAPAGQPAQRRRRDNDEPHSGDEVSPHLPVTPRHVGNSEKDDVASDMPAPTRRRDNKKPRREDDLPTDLPAVQRRTGNSGPKKDDVAADTPGPRGRRSNNTRRAGDVPEDSIPQPPSRKSNSKSRLRAGLKLQTRRDDLDAQPPSGQSRTCEGRDCAFRTALLQETAVRKRNEKDLESTKKLLDEARAQIKELNQGKERKQEAQQVKLSLAEQKRRNKLDAAERERQHKGEARREERAHKLALEALKTPEERIAEQEARQAKLKLATGVVKMAGKCAVEAHRTHSETRREGARDSGSRTTARRPTTAPSPASRPTPKHQHRE